MKKMILLVIVMGLVSGCASPFYSVDKNGPLASVTYARQDVNHYISQDTGEVVPEEEKATFPGKLITTEHRRTFPTVIYVYKSIECSSAPVVMGNLKTEKPNDILTLQVKAGVPLVNSYRTKYKTHERDAYKYFFTSSMFIPEENARYEMIIEPIDGVTVYKLEKGKKIKQEVTSNLPDVCQY